MKKVVFGLIIIFSIFMTTGCVVFKKDNPMIGSYELQELNADETTMTGEEWKNLTTMDMTLIVNKDNTLNIVYEYTNQNKKDIDYYTYDKEFIYGTNNPGTVEGEKYYSYEFSDGLLKITTLNDTHNTIYIYKKK